jgi:hypothetical protein
MISENFDFREKTVTIIDPFPSQTLEKFSTSINAKIVTKSLDNITLSDIS